MTSCDHSVGHFEGKTSGMLWATRRGEESPDELWLWLVDNGSNGALSANVYSDQHPSSSAMTFVRRLIVIFFVVVFLSNTKHAAYLLYAVSVTLWYGNWGRGCRLQLASAPGGRGLKTHPHVFFFINLLFLQHPQHSPFNQTFIPKRLLGGECCKPWEVTVREGVTFETVVSRVIPTSWFANKKEKNSGFLTPVFGGLLRKRQWRWCLACDAVGTSPLTN